MRICWVGPHLTLASEFVCNQYIKLNWQILLSPIVGCSGSAQFVNKLFELVSNLGWAQLYLLELSLAKLHA